MTLQEVYDGQTGESLVSLLTGRNGFISAFKTSADGTQPIKREDAEREISRLMKGDDR
jgi:hypothetical protein